MIISKKKFERMVEEEVHKRMNAADEKRWQDERINNLERSVDRQLERIYERMRNFEEKLENLSPNKPQCCDEKPPMMFKF